MDAQKKKIERYHYDEMVFILLILASDLSQYHDDLILCFAEEIEGTMDTVFGREFLESLDHQYALTPEIIDRLESLMKDVQALYAPGWSELLKQPKKLISIRRMADKILKDLGIDHVDPMSYNDVHLEGVDWT
jgi:hypothetical protein